MDTQKRGILLEQISFSEVIQDDNVHLGKLDESKLGKITFFKTKKATLAYGQDIGVFSKKQQNVGSVFYQGVYSPYRLTTAEIKGVSAKGITIILVNGAMRAINPSYLLEMQSPTTLIEILQEALPSDCQKFIKLNASSLTTGFSNKAQKNIEVSLLPNAYHPILKKDILCKYVEGCFVFDNCSIQVANTADIPLQSIQDACLQKFQDIFAFEPFGCCSRYKECSGAKICLHEDLLYSKVCMYRKNLEKGLIFYGRL